MRNFSGSVKYILSITQNIKCKLKIAKYRLSHKKYLVTFLYHHLFGTFLEYSTKALSMYSNGIWLVRPVTISVAALACRPITLFFCSFSFCTVLIREKYSGNSDSTVKLCWLLQYFLHPAFVIGNKSNNSSFI